MRKLMASVALLACVAVLIVGCDWTDSSHGDRWNDRYNWINFSGLYVGINGFIVRSPAQGALPSPSPTPTPTPTPGEDGTVVINNEYGGIAPLNQTSLSGNLNFRPGITPGSITIVLARPEGGLSSGSASDDGAGGLVGSFNLVGLDDTAALPMTGTINYTTGAWTLNLTSPGLVTSAEIYISYAYDSGEGQGGGNVQPLPPPSGGDGPSDSTPPYQGILSMRVEQLGNRIFITDSKNGHYEGVVTTVTTGGADQSGRTSGTVEMLFQAEGYAHDGRWIQITGSFLGAYLAPTPEDSTQTGTVVREFGVLQERVIQGIWVEPTGQTANIIGAGGSLTVDMPVPMTPINQL